MKILFSFHSIYSDEGLHLKHQHFVLISWQFATFSFYNIQYTAYYKQLFILIMDGSFGVWVGGCNPPK